MSCMGEVICIYRKSVMKKFYLCLLLVLFTFSHSGVMAQATEGVNSFKQDKDAWRRKEHKEEVSNEITQKIKDGVAIHGLNNIIDAEQVFCYTVAKAGKKYSGYTIDGMSVTGYCGLLTKTDVDLFIQEFLTKDKNTSNVVANCVIEPKVMLRFVKGVDYTDVLLSSPCHSFSVFYAGKVKSFNAQPSSHIVDAFVGAYTANPIEFVSPALLGQLMPIGVARNSEQMALVKSKSGQAPIRKWSVGESKEVKEEPVEKKELKGWNKLKR